MDIYQFVDSQAIREHLQKLDYHFHGKEMAFLIWWSKKKTLEEKIWAWQELIEHTSDEIILLSRRRGVKGSLHQTLREHVDALKKDMDQFQNGKDCIYRY
ncbi:hypothetical protein AALB16_02880 [Lachnospiraceae bacterium 62-35]